MKTYKLKTKIDEVIDYDNIVVEVSEDKIIPKKTETIIKEYTPKKIQDEIDNLNIQIKELTIKKDELELLKSKIKIEADKVGKIIKKIK